MAKKINPMSKARKRARLKAKRERHKENRKLLARARHVVGEINERFGGVGPEVRRVVAVD